jgi:hypothetical protein
VKHSETGYFLSAAQSLSMLVVPIIQLGTWLFLVIGATGFWVGRTAHVDHQPATAASEGGI